MPNYPDAMLARVVNTSRLLGCQVQSLAFFLYKVMHDEKLLIIVKI